MKYLGLANLFKKQLERNIERTSLHERESIVKIANEVVDKANDLLLVLNKHSEKPFLVLILSFLLELLIKYSEKKERKRRELKDNKENEVA